MKFAVVGAGVVGLTTALELQKQFPKANVTIIADRFGENTTSYVAAGIFRPGTTFSGPNETITRQWINDAYQYWDDLNQLDENSKTGVRRLGVYAFSENSPHLVKNRYIEKLLPIYRSLTEEELSICPGNWKYGSYYDTLLTDFNIFNRWATKKFREANGQIKMEHLLKLGDLKGQYDIILNCTGFGARELCKDLKVIPIRGQVLKVRAPWIKTAFYAECDTYIIPSFNGCVTLGGVREYDDWSKNINENDTIGILKRCQKIVPSISSAEVLQELVDLRPHRDIVRVEPQIIDGLKVVHNYGHGGYGVTTSPGTAKYSVQLVKDFLCASGSKL